MINKYNHYFLISLFSLILVVPLNLSAQGGFAIGGKIGTTGFGIEAAYGLTDVLNIRGSLTGYDFTISYTTDGNDPDVKFDLDSDNTALSILLDYVPFKQGFRITGGFIHQGPRFRGVGIPVESYTDPQSGVTIPANQMGSVTIDLDYENKLSPYLGIGFGNPVGRNRVTMSLDAGIIFSGKPTITSRSVGKLAEVLDYDEQELRDNVEKYNVLPLITIGLSVKLF